MGPSQVTLLAASLPTLREKHAKDGAPSVVVVSNNIKTQELTVTRRSLLSALLCCSILFVVELSAQSIQVVNTDGHATTLTAEQIANAPHVAVDAHDHAGIAHFEGVPLSDVLSLAGVQLGDTLRGPRMAEALLVEAADGYKVVFALTEADPAFAAREIILADKRDGKALDAKEGPLRIVAPGDARPARWVRQVTTLRVIAVK